MLSTIQLALMPLSFGLLFFLMLLYWGQAAFFSYTKYKKFSNFVFYLSFASLTGLLLIRWAESGHFPLSNLYESLLFLSWSFLLGQLILQSYSSLVIPHEKSTKIPHLQKDEDEFVHLLTVLTSPLAVISYAFAFLNLPKEMQKATSLVPALQSNWLMMHVTIMILSYAALLCGCILSMAFLLIRFTFSKQTHSQISRRLFTEKEQDKKHPYIVGESAYAITAQSLDIVLTKPERTLPEEEQFFKDSFKDVSKIHNSDQRLLSLSSKLDNLSYRILGLGFPLLTVGILSGAVWANSAWGSYWSWDPKETWALITWLVFAIYLHARITKRWSGDKPAIIATVGFFVVWFSYLGVNLIGTGLHSYGWFRA